MTEKPKAYLANRLYVPEHLVTKSHEKAYTYWFGPEQSDNEEDYEVIKTYRQFRSGWYGFARGNLDKIKEVFGEDFEFDDQRALVPHGYDLQFTGDLRPEQQEVWLEWARRGWGMIEAPPRWGKTVFMVWMLTKLKQRSLVLAQEWSLLEQFEEDLRRFTNIDQLERDSIKKYGREAGRLVGFGKKDPSHVFPLVTLTSWQTYDSNLDVLRANRDAWGAVFVDEAHSAAAPCFLRVVNTTNSYYRIPVTATPERKDGHEVAIFDIAGTVTAVGKTEQLPVHVKVVRTGIKIPYMAGANHNNHRMFWLKMRRFLSKHEQRNKLIVQRVLADVSAGRKVLLVSDLIPHLKALQAMLIEEAKKSRQTKRMRTALLIGEVKGQARKALRHDAKNGKIDVVLAYSKIVQLGWNVPPWSSLHNVLPMSNEPNWYQRISRIRTPCAKCPGVNDSTCLSRGVCGKQQPVCHIYVDDSKMLESCLRTQQRVHSRLGFLEDSETVDLEPSKRDPTRPGKGLMWTEI